MNLSRFAVAVMMLLAVLLSARSGFAQTSQAAVGKSEDLLIDWTNPEGAKWTFKARIDRPPTATDRGRAVFMFGGGFSNDIDWTTPGRFEHAGQAMQLTISGQDSRDGLTLAEAMVADGWTVIRYSAIREGDPLHAQSRGMAEAMPYPGTLELARFMWKELLRRAGFELDQVVALDELRKHEKGKLKDMIVLKRGNRLSVTPVTKSEFEFITSLA